MSDLARLLQQYGYGLPPASPQGETVSTSNVLADALRVAGVPKKDEHGFLFSNVGGNLKFNPWEAVKGFMSYQAPPGALSTSGDDAPVRNSAEAAGWLGLSGLGLNFAGQVPKNALGIFGGRLAKTADHAALAKAEELAAKGADRKDIWDQTGWFQGADGKWRFEIDDSASRWLAPPPDDVRPGNVINMTSEKALEHPELYRAYPDGVSRPVMYPKPTDATGMPMGSYNPDKDAFFVRARNAEWGGPDPRSIFLHEWQHRLQREEGFQPGGSASNVIPRTYNSLAAQINDLLAPYAGNPPKEVKEEVAKLKQRMKAIPDDPAEAYRRLIGEVEARNVQTRMNMMPEERRARPPWETEDVPIPDQIR